MNLAWFKNRYAVAAIFVAILVGIILTIKLLPKNSANQSVFVLAFTNNELTNEKLWAESAFSIDSISDCNSTNEQQDVACVAKYIQSIVGTAQALNVQLIVLGQGNYPKKILAALQQITGAEKIDALVFLQSEDVSLLNDKYRFPKTLIISSAQDSHADVVKSRQLASMLNRSHWAWFTMLLSDQSNNLLSHPIIPNIVTYLLNGAQGTLNDGEFDAEVRWQRPIFNNQAYYANPKAIAEYNVDANLSNTLQAFFSHEPYLLKQWPLEKYRGFDLLKYRSQLPLEKQGRYVSFSNRKGHRFYLDLNRYGRYLPEIVIGLDDETNLYHLTSFYRTKRFNSWEEGGPSEDMLYAESLGAFIHFRKPVPAQYELPYLQYSSILFESISFSNQDPYAELSNLTYPTFRVLTMNCLPCHSVGEIGGAAHHIDSKLGQPQPGYALALTAYSQEVLENFFFNQSATADLIGVNPNHVERRVAQELLVWLQQYQ